MPASCDMTRQRDIGKSDNRVSGDDWELKVSDGTQFEKNLLHLFEKSDQKCTHTVYVKESVTKADRRPHVTKRILHFLRGTSRERIEMPVDLSCNCSLRSHAPVSR